MSRSRRHTPFIGIAGSSEKQDKRKANRKFRRLVKERIESDDDANEALPVGLREVSDCYSFSKDGQFRFDPKQYPKLMRK